MKKPSRLILALTFTTFLSTLCAKNETHDIFPGEHWEPAPEAFLQGRWDRDLLLEAETKWEELKEEKKSVALLVIDSGYVVLSLGKVDKPLPCYSVRKSLVSGLFGALSTDTEINLNTSLDSLGIDDIHPLSEQEKSATIRHLLQSRSGVYHVAEYESPGMKRKRPARNSHEPGELFYYNNWDFNALGSIYEKLSGRGIFDDFDTKIATPLGFEHFDRQKHTEHRHNNAEDPFSRHAARIFKLSLEDRARFGLLYLNKGKWEQDEIIPKKWIEESIVPYSTHESDPDHLYKGQEFGYSWWTHSRGWLFSKRFVGKPFSARGSLNNYIAIIPEENLVVLHANQTQEGWQEAGRSWNQLFRKVINAKLNVKMREEDTDE